MMIAALKQGRILVLGLALGLILQPAVAQPRQEQVQFARGTSGATVQGRVRGDGDVDYRLSLRAGQPLTVVLHSHNSSLYFNVLAPAAEEALFVGSTSGNRYSGAVPAGGDYTIRVYLMRNAARRGETAAFSLEIQAPPARGDAPVPATGGSSGG